MYIILLATLSHHIQSFNRNAKAGHSDTEDPGHLITGRMIPTLLMNTFESRKEPFFWKEAVFLKVGLIFFHLLFSLLN